MDVKAYIHKRFDRCKVEIITPPIETELAYSTFFDAGKGCVEMWST